MNTIHGVFTKNNIVAEKMLEEEIWIFLGGKKKETEREQQKRKRETIREFV